MALFPGVQQCVSLYDPQIPVRNPVKKDFCGISVLNWKYVVIISFRQIDCVEIKSIRIPSKCVCWRNQIHGYDKGFSYRAVCVVKLINQTYLIEWPHGSISRTD